MLAWLLLLPLLVMPVLAWLLLLLLLVLPVPLLLSLVPLLLSDVVADARPTVNAYANMMNGGGYESEKNYPDMSLHFAEIPNIHVVRSSHQHLKQAAAAPLPPAVVQADGWTSVLSLILQAALLVVKSVHQDNSAVLVHCSDGW